MTSMDRPIKKRKWVRKLILGVFIFGGLAAVAIYYFYFQDRSSKLNVDARKIIISTVTKEPFQEFIPVLGKVEPISTVYLDAIEGGQVEKKFIEVGAFVNKGDKILELSNTNLVLSLMQREAEYYNQEDILQKSRLSLEQYKLNFSTQLNDMDYQINKEKNNYDESQYLYSKNLISKSKFREDKDKYEYLLEKKKLALENFEQETLLRQVQIEQVEASVKRMSSNLKIIRDRLDRLTIRAPISGQLTILDAEIGESKSPGKRLGEINVVTDLKVSVEIDEHYIDRIEEGNTGNFDFSGQTSELKISKIFPDVKNNQFEVEMVFPGEPLKGIRIGQTLHIKLALGNLEEALTIPTGGFFQTTAGQWIYVLDGSVSSATKRDIRIGRKNPNAIEVLEGLNEGEKVITSNYDNFERMDKLVLKY